MTVCDFGAMILSVKSRVGTLNVDDPKYEELTLCRDDITSLRNRDLNPYYGATIGRVAGRIGDGKFTIAD